MNNKVASILCSLGVVGMLLLSAWGWIAIPDAQPIPVHFGIDGTPDRYGGKFEGLLLLPILAAGFTLLLFAVIPRIDPRAGNLARSEKAYATTGAASIGFLLLVHSAITLQTLGWPVDVVMVIAIGVGVLLATIGNYLGKVRSNFFFGIRTPWTLSSDHVWSKTHRLGGRLFFGLGIGCAVAGFTRATGMFLVMILGGSLSISLFLVVYSYLLWKHDVGQQQLDRLR